MCSCIQRCDCECARVFNHRTVHQNITEFWDVWSHSHSRHHTAAPHTQVPTNHGAHWTQDFKYLLTRRHIKLDSVRVTEQYSRISNLACIFTCMLPCSASRSLNSLSPCPILLEWCMLTLNLAHLEPLCNRPQEVAQDEVACHRRSRLRGGDICNKPEPDDGCGQQ